MVISLRKLKITFEYCYFVVIDSRQRKKLPGVAVFDVSMFVQTVLKR